jgi:arginase
VSARVTVLRGRTSDRSADGVRGAQALGEAFAARLGVEAELVGEPGPPREARWDADLRDGRAAIAAAGAALEAALDGGALPVLLATTASGYLGGMSLAAACGRWDGGFGAGMDPRRVVLSDGRDLDAAEREEIARAGLAMVAPADVAAAVRGERVFVHVDFDVLDPSEMPFSFPAPGGLSLGELRALLAELAGAAEIAGIELASIAAPNSAARLVEALEPLVGA